MTAKGSVQTGVRRWEYCSRSSGETGKFDVGWAPPTVGHPARPCWWAVLPARGATKPVAPVRRHEHTLSVFVETPPHPTNIRGLVSSRRPPVRGYPVLETRPAVSAARHGAAVRAFAPSSRPWPSDVPAPRA